MTPTVTELLAALKNHPAAEAAETKILEAAALMRRRAGYAARMTKLSVAASAERESVERRYAELGRLYYREHCDTAEGLLAALCGEIRAANDRIEADERAMEELRAALAAAEPAPELKALLTPADPE